MMKKNDLIKFGECKKPHGIKGGFSFHLYNTEESHLKNNTVVHLIPINDSSSIPSEGQDYTISSIQMGNKTICYLENITDRNITEAMIPFDIYMYRKELKSLGHDEFYFDDLIGLKVIDSETEQEVGEVHNFYENGSQLVLMIRGPKGTHELPYVKEFFPDLNIEEGWIKMKRYEVYSER